MQDSPFILPKLTRPRQDLFSSIFLGTYRIVRYEDFYPSQQLIIEHAGGASGPPSGFIRSTHLLGSEIMNAATDVATLYANRQQWLASSDSADGPEGLDNVQAQMEGRIHSLRQANVDDMLLCCIIALQLCVYGFWDGIWNSALIPRELSTKLLYHLHRCQRHDIEDDELFFWLVYVGKAFAADAEVRNQIDRLWFKRHCNAGESTLPPWGDANYILSKFIWSEVLYSVRNGWFWERIRE